MPKVVMYSSRLCSFCRMAERLLHSKGVQQIETILVDIDPVRLSEMVSKTRRRSVPQIFIGDHHVGGFDDLVALDRSGGLDELLQA
jgi:glutaredoxin 3